MRNDVHFLGFYSYYRAPKNAQSEIRVVHNFKSVFPQCEHFCESLTPTKVVKNLPAFAALTAGMIFPFLSISKQELIERKRESEIKFEKEWARKVPACVEYIKPDA